MIKDYLNIIVPGQSELIHAFEEWYQSSALLAIGILAYVIIVALPLRQIDRRDWLAGCTYVACCTTAGVIMVLAIPERLDGHGERSGLILALLALAIPAIYRWYQVPAQIIRETIEK